MLAEDEERLAAPVAQGAHVGEIGHVGGGHDAPVPPGAQLIEAVGWLGRVQPHLVVVGAGLVLDAPVAGHIAVAHQACPSSSGASPLPDPIGIQRGPSASSSATRLSWPSRPTRHIWLPCGNRALSTLNSAITSLL